MYRSVRRSSLIHGHRVCLYITQQYSPDPSGLIEAVAVDLYVLVLSPHSVWKDPVPLGFPEICMWCGSHLKWLHPRPPALFPSSFSRISLCLLMPEPFRDLHKNIKKGKKKKKIVNRGLPSRVREQGQSREMSVWHLLRSCWYSYRLPF